MGWVTSKTKQFKGKDKMLERWSNNNAENRKKLICLHIEPGSLIVGSEPILCDDMIVGYVRRAETGKNIFRYLVNCALCVNCFRSYIGQDNCIWLFGGKNRCQFICKMASIVKGTIGAGKHCCKKLLEYE